MVRYKTVLLLILTLCGAALVYPLSPTDVASEHHSDAPFLGLVSPPAMASSDLLDLTAELTYSTYFGGSGSDDHAHTVADSKGN
ncbi:MAG: hypothetical protein ACW96N_09540, partial [Candidatus Thorarchaeota archaeon]